MDLYLGAYCLGYCWLPMGLLFVGGVMNQLVVSAISIFVPIEKATPAAEAGRILGSGALLVAAAVLVGHSF